MNYPLLSEYIESIKSAEDNFNELSYLWPVLDDDGLPVMTNGNFAVVFKMKDARDGKLYAVKCFTREQEGREEAYKVIAEELKSVESLYIVPIRYLEKELFVDSMQTDETEFPVLLMDWVEGKTLDKYLRENLDDKYSLEMLAYRFSQLAQWIIPQPFAHGDLKPDNILVREDGTLVLVDYDGMYVPAMKGQKARELGSPDFRHPLRTENDFDEHIDDFPIVSILLSLKAISINPSLLEEYGAADRLLLSERDYNLGIESDIVHELSKYNDEALKTLLGLFVGECFLPFNVRLPQMLYPFRDEEYMFLGIKGIDILIPNKTKVVTDTDEASIGKIVNGLKELNCFMNLNGIDFKLTGTLGLYLHGFSPNNYVPHDIDIRISTNKNNYYHICNVLSLAEDLYMIKSGYDDDKTIKTFSFYIGINKISVNAFLVNEQEDDYHLMDIQGQIIKVHNVLGILKEKYLLAREKDFIFNTQIQELMNHFLLDKERCTLKEKISDN